MENSFFLRIEIIIFFISLAYIVYYLYEKMVITFKGIKNIISPSNKILKTRINEFKKKKDGVELNNYEKLRKDSKKSEEKSEKNISLQELKKIGEIVKRAKLNKSKGYYGKAKSLIIEGLSIDKFNKDLNIELASIYEEEKNYKKAEYIYNDLLTAFADNFEILKKLGYNLAIQKRYNDSIDIYTKGYEKNSGDVEIMEFLADLNYEVKNYKRSLKYIKIYLKQFPRNTEKLKMRGFCHETLGEVDTAISVYKKIIELQPYNSQVSEKIKYLETQI